MITLQEETAEIAEDTAAAAKVGQDHVNSGHCARLLKIPHTFSSALSSFCAKAPLFTLVCVIHDSYKFFAGGIIPQGENYDEAYLDDDDDEDSMSESSYAVGPNIEGRNS